MTLLDIHRIAWFLASKHTHVDQEDLYQIAYLEGLEALEKGVDDVYGAMMSVVGHAMITIYSPVEVPASSAVHSAASHLRKGGLPRTPTERRMVSVLGPREEILPITLVTTDTPESLLESKQIMDKLKTYLEHSNLFLTEKQRDAIGVVFFGSPTQEEFMENYNVSRSVINWHSDQAVEKIKKALGV